MTTKEQIAEYCNNRITPEEFEQIKDYVCFDDTDFESLEDFKQQFDLASITGLIAEDVTTFSNVDCAEDLISYLEDRVKLIRIVRKIVKPQKEKITDKKKLLAKLEDEINKLNSYLGSIPADHFIERGITLGKINGLLTAKLYAVNLLDEND